MSTVRTMMEEHSQRLGTFVETSAGGERMSAPLPPTPQLVRVCERAIAAVGRLDGVTTILPSTSLSSRIEGRQSSLFDLLLCENDEAPLVEHRRCHRNAGGFRHQLLLSRVVVCPSGARTTRPFAGAWRAGGHCFRARIMKRICGGSAVWIDAPATLTRLLQTGFPGWQAGAACKPEPAPAPNRRGGIAPPDSQGRLT